MTRELPMIDADADLLPGWQAMPLPREDWWIVLAYHHAGWWTTRPGLYSACAAAIAAAKKLPSCWTAFQIVRIPGSQT